MPETTTARPIHLARRFFGSLRPGGPSRAEREWVEALLGTAEIALWERMGGPDRRHAVEVARRLRDSADGEEDRVLLAAALLHDVGKVAAGLGTYGRVIATLAASVAGHSMARQWSEKRGFTRRVGLYLQHPELGADLLELAGSDPLVVAWAREHHRAEAEWTVPLELGRALRAADQD